MVPKYTWALPVSPDALMENQPEGLKHADLSGWWRNNASCQCGDDRQAYTLGQGVRLTPVDQW